MSARTLPPPIALETRCRSDRARQTASRRSKKVPPGSGQGLPALLLKDDKVTGGIQLGLWVLSWILAFFLIGFVLWIGVAIWSAIDGHQAAMLWNHRHGFIT